MQSLSFSKPIHEKEDFGLVQEGRKEHASRHQDQSQVHDVGIGGACYEQVSQ